MTAENLENLTQDSQVQPCAMTEAGGVAWADIYVGGLRVSVTARADSPIRALDELVAALRYAKERYGATVKPKREDREDASPENGDSAPADTPTPREPVYVPIDKEPRLYRVSSLKHIVSKKGTHMLVVSMDGRSESAFAYERVIPEKSWRDWRVFVEVVDVPAAMRYCTVDEDKGLVSGFYAEKPGR